MARPTKYKAEYAEQARKLCELGATNEKLADFFEVSITSIDRWIAKHDEFRGAIKIGREEADNMVEMSLYRRACGFSHDDTHISSYQGDVKVTPIVKHYPPETAACIFWLKNRRPDKWRDKVDGSDGGIDFREVARIGAALAAAMDAAESSPGTDKADNGE